jgi:hypothetical protein
VSKRLTREDMDSTLLCIPETVTVNAGRAIALVCTLRRTAAQLLLPAPTAAMYAVMSGTCSVFVDPHYKEASGQLGETDPKKTLQVGGWARQAAQGVGERQGGRHPGREGAACGTNERAMVAAQEQHLHVPAGHGNASAM